LKGIFNHGPVLGSRAIAEGVKECKIKKEKLKITEKQRAKEIFKFEMGDTEVFGETPNVTRQRRVLPFSDSDRMSLMAASFSEEG
jgi:hypothetical protein